LVKPGRLPDIVIDNERAFSATLHAPLSIGSNHSDTQDNDSLVRCIPGRASGHRPRVGAERTPPQAARKGTPD